MGGADAKRVVGGVSADAKAARPRSEMRSARGSLHYQAPESNLKQVERPVFDDQEEGAEGL